MNKIYIIGAGMFGCSLARLLKDKGHEVTLIEKEKEIVERMSALENKVIPDSFDYDKVAALSIEAMQKFKKIRPVTLGQASRISGVNPSDIQILMVYMGR